MQSLSPTKLGTVIENLGHFLAHLNLGLTNSLAARGAENLMGTQPHQLKAPIIL